MDTNLPQEVIDLINSGNKIEAIKILREITGMGLKEAKDAVESGTVSKPEKDTDVILSEKVLDKLREGKKIDAIRILREETGLGLKDSKELVEYGLDSYPDVKQQFEAISRYQTNRLGKIILLIFIVILLFYLLQKFF